MAEEDTVVTIMTAGGDSRKAQENQKRAVNPLKERSRVFIGCLYALHRRNSRMCFTAAFIDKMFRPYLYNKLSRWDGDIHDAVKLWCSDRAAAEKQYGHISKWDVSHVTNMNVLFYDRQIFNEDISAWDVRSVISMESMFYGAARFNQPLAAWNVSSVESMRGMFSRATSFNQPLAGWDVSKVQDMANMFYEATSFNQPLAGWDVSNVQHMGRMFHGATSFNQPLAGWDVSKMESMKGMFDGAS